MKLTHPLGKTGSAHPLGHTIHIQPSHRGRLHAALGVPQGQPIPAGKIAAAKNSSSPAIRKEATFADNARKWSHK